MAGTSDEKAQKAIDSAANNLLLSLLGVWLLSFCTMVAGVAFNAWVVSLLYRWFVLTAFSAAPALSIAQVAGLVLLCRTLRGFRRDDDLDKSEKKSPSDLALVSYRTLKSTVIFGLLVLGIALCIRFFL